MKLGGKVAIVTGATRGIGKAIAIDFAKEGAIVVVTGRSKVDGKLPGTIYETAKEIERNGGKAIAIKCDISLEEEVDDLVKKTLTELGSVDVLVNNAALAYYRTVTETPTKHWDLVMRINVRGPFLCIKAVLPLMIEQKSGSILNISSSAAENIFSFMERTDGEKHLSGCAYGGSKAALERLSRGLAEEVREHNIAVNTLRPAKATWSEGAVLWNPDVDESTFISPHLYLTKAATFLATQDAAGITGGVFYDKDLCEQYKLLYREPTL